MGWTTIATERSTIWSRAPVAASAAKEKKRVSTVFGKIAAPPNLPKRSAMGSITIATDSSTTTRLVNLGRAATKANARQLVKKTKIVQTKANVSRDSVWVIHAKVWIVPKARRVCRVVVWMLAPRSHAPKGSFVAMESAVTTRVMGWVVPVGRFV